MNNHQHNSEQQQQRKVYTMEDNVKSISFGMRDLVKQIELLNQTLLQLVRSSPQKEGDQNVIPF